MFGETTIFHVKIWNHPIETTIYKWLFGVPGIYIYISGQIIATSHDLGPQKVAKEGKSPYFREIQVGEIL